MLRCAVVLASRMRCVCVFGTRLMWYLSSSLLKMPSGGDEQFRRFGGAGQVRGDVEGRWTVSPARPGCIALSPQA